MNELEALNMLLRGVGIRGVNDFETTVPAAENARDILKRHRGEAQARGWWFNIDYNLVYQPDPVTGEIILPSQVRAIVPEHPAIVKRGLKLYNKYDQTFIFSENVPIYREHRILAWDELPETMQTHIAYRALADFINDELGDTEKEDKAIAKAGLALVQVQKEDLEAGRYNVFNNARVLRARGGVRPHNTGRSSNLFTR